MRRHLVILMALLVTGLLLWQDGALGRRWSLAGAQEQKQARGLEDEREQREKEHAEYLRSISDRTGRPRPDLLRRGIEQVQRMQLGAQVRLSKKATAAASVIGVQWKQIGPAPLRIDKEMNFQGTGPDSGEVVDLAIDPRNTTDRVVYIATNDGGIWKTTDGGASWKPKTDFMPSLSMGAVALDPGNPSIVYAGTGNPFDGGAVIGRFSGQFSKGVGIYKSVDGGETWSIVGSNVFNQVNIVRIKLPAPGVLLVATTSGLFRSANGGVSFGNNAPLFNNNQPVLNGYISDLALDTATATSVLAAVRGQGIFSSTDSGVTFPTNLFTATNGAPTANVQFISFAQSTQPNNQTLYASVQDARAQTTPPMPAPFPFLGLYRSVNGGMTWTRLAGADAVANGCQCGYDQTVGVDPQDANRVYIGFQELFMSTNGGGNFTNISDGKIHWDHHAIYFSPASHISSSPPTRVWVGTDGGVHSSTNAGTNWANLNEGIATNLFFSLDIGRGNPFNNGFSYGGTQDTGTIERRPTFAGKDWHLGIDGDGGRIAVDSCNPNIAIGTDNANYIRTTDGGDNWSFFRTTGNLGAAGFPANTSVGVVKFDPNCGIAYAGAVTAPPMTATIPRLFRSADNGLNFTAVRTFNAGITAMALTRIDSNTLWVALGNGTVQRTANASAGAAATWTTVTVNGAPAGLAPSAIAIDPTNTDQVVLVYGGFTALSNANRTKHVFRTLDNGATWTDISGTDGGDPNRNLPDLPLRDVVIDPGTSPHTIIVANDAGVLRTTDLGATWERYGVGLPTVLCTALAIDTEASPALLRVGTYGRSVFELGSAEGPLLAVNSNLAFGDLCQEVDEVRSVELFNVGSANLHINSFFRLAGSTDFQLSSGPPAPTTIRPGEHLDFSIRFNPTGGGAKTAVFRVNSDDPFQPSFDLSASGTALQAQLAALITDQGSFGTVCAGSFRDLDLTLNNSGGCPLRITGFTSSSTQFVVPNVMSFPLVLQPGDVVQIPLRFQPSGTGARTATFTVVSNDPTNGSKTFEVSGVAGSPAIATVLANAGDFGTVCEGGFKDLDLTLNNSGACPLRITNLTSSSSQFLAAGVMSFPLVIHAGDTLHVPLRFQPTGTGNRNATFTITSNDPVNGTKTLDVSGVAGSPTIAAAIANTGNFGTVCEGSHKDLDLTLNNSGVCDLQINGITSSSGQFLTANVLSFPLVIHAGAALRVPLRFQPTGTGNRNATFTIASNDPVNGTKTVTVSGVAGSPTIATVIADAGNFGDVCVGKFKDLALTLHNSGVCDLRVTSIASSSAEFQLAGVMAFPLVIAPGSSLSVPIRFQPVSYGMKNATITVNSNDPVNPAKSVAVSGNVPPATIVVPDLLDFGKVCPGDTKNLTLTIGNSGGCDLIVKSITSDSPEFKVVGIVPFPLVIPPGSTRDVTIQFMPMSFGNKMATLTIMSNDLVTPNKTVAVKGSAPPPIIQVAPAALDFSKVCLGASKDLPLTIKNAGECNMTVASVVSSSPEFKLVNPPSFPLVIPPGGMTTLTVRFSPVGSTGPRVATLTINSDDPATPVKTVPLSGLVPVSAISLTGDFDFGSVMTNKVRDQIFNLTNTEPCDLLITLICELSGGAIPTTSAEFDVISPAVFPVLVRGGTTLPVMIRFKPQGKGPRTAKLIVFGHDPQTSNLLLRAEYQLKGIGK